MSGFGVLAEGAGQIDLGAQTVDFSLRPRLTGTNANALGSFGIPIRMKGKFGATSVGLDSDLLSQIVAEKAKAEAAKLIQNQVGGQLGGVLGGVIGNGGTSTGTTGSLGSTLGGVINGNGGSSGSTSSLGSVLGGVVGGQTGGETSPTQGTPSSGSLGGILGGIIQSPSAPTQQAPNTTPQPAPAPKKTDEEKVEDVFRGLFGK